MALRVSREMLDPRARQVRSGLKGRRAPRARQEPTRNVCCLRPSALVRLALRENKVSQESRALRESLEQLVLRVSQDLKGQPEMPAQRVQQVLKEIRVRRAQWVQQVHKDRQAPPDPPARTTRP